MPRPKRISLLVALLLCNWAHGLEPNEILVVANRDNALSERLARYYCQARNVPQTHIVGVSLGTELRDSMSREDYEKRLARPIRRLLGSRSEMADIKCLVTTYGVPFRVGRRDPLSGFQIQLTELNSQLRQQRQAIEDLEGRDMAGSAEHAERSRRVTQLQMDINRITGRESEAAVDSELSLVLFGAYELYRWQPNMLSRNELQVFKTLMVSRLDGPSYAIAQGLVDKALVAEPNELTGNAYIDSRGIFDLDTYGRYDQSLRDLTLLTRLRTKLPAQEENTQKLFQPGSCPETALYCGWYSLKHYIDAFDFVDGAVGFHIASFEAANLRDANSKQWCPTMLADGITATLGAVAEPYLYAFPEPKAFFLELFNGSCLVEAFYRTKPFNSWQLVLIGDPLYRPFKDD
jgi:uncharacterized protein (TIGR03790 family)